MRIDAHQHFWDIQRFQYPWMPPTPSPLRRTFLPGDLQPILEQNRFDGTVLVQANSLPEETHWFLDLAGRHAFILGVVGWVDLMDPNLGRTLDVLQKHAKFKGARHIVHDEPDEKWLLREDVLRGLKELARRAIPYDLLLRPQHLRLVPILAEKLPGLRMVIDHIAKPLIATQQMDGWDRDIERAAQIPQVFCKLSGMITEADHKMWKAADLQRYVQHVYRLFGANRLMFGSDWPVCLLAGTWKQVLAAFTQALGPIPPADRDQMLGETARRFYNLSVAKSNSAVSISDTLPG
jgi:L-fuconolactonase